MKLSKAQLNLLRDLPTSCAEHYAPARKLVEMGLAHWGGGWCVLSPTESGKAELERVSIPSSELGAKRT